MLSFSEQMEPQELSRVADGRVNVHSVWEGKHIVTEQAENFEIPSPLESSLLFEAATRPCCSLKDFNYGRCLTSGC